MYSIRAPVNQTVLNNARHFNNASFHEMKRFTAREFSFDAKDSRLNHTETTGRIPNEKTFIGLQFHLFI